MRFRHIARATLASSLALALVACGGGEDATASGDEEVAEVEPIAAIPAPDGQTWAEMATETPEGGILVGNPDAPIKLVEYASHTCSHCADFAGEAAEELRSDYISTGRVSFELRNLIRDGLDLTIAQLVRCGEPEGVQPLADQAWGNLNQMFETAQANGAAMEAAMQAKENVRYKQIAEASGLYDFFAARGISRDQAAACLSDPAKGRAILERSQTQANELNIEGTPTFFLNGRNIGTHNWASLEPLLQRAGAR
ncbi:thioredoxin domain-containing protein [Altererythrobacter sp. CAU 1778]